MPKFRANLSWFIGHLGIRHSCHGGVERTPGVSMPPPKLQEGLECTPLSTLDWDQHLAIQTHPDSLHQQTDCLQAAPSLREAMGHGVGRQWDPGVKS